MTRSTLTPVKRDAYAVEIVNMLVDGALPNIDSIFATYAYIDVVVLCRIGS